MHAMMALVLLLMFGVAAADLSPDAAGAESASADSIDFRFDDHRWTHRLLFIVTPSRDDASYRQQMTRFADADAGFRERDLLLIEVVEEGPSRLGHQPLTADAEARLRSRFEMMPSAFRVVLVGKDGTEKRRDASPVAARAIFATIDAMPMRQREMRENGGG